MKKTLVLALGMTFVAGSAISLGEASREAYQAYLYEKAQNTNYTSVFKGENKTSKIIQRKRSITMKRLENVMGRLETYENETYSIQIPLGWKKFSENTIFTNPGSKFKVEIKKLDAQVCEDALSFDMCTVHLSKMLNNQAVGGLSGRLIATSRVIRRNYTSDAILHDRSPINVATESFSTQLKNNNYTINRYFIQDPESGVYVIETKMLTQNTNRYKGLSKVIFDSFRIYPTS